jgi:predicted nuclease of restriction endonuclease-like (RecB) superfamily
LYLFDKELDKLDISENQSNQSSIIDQLRNKNEQLENSMNERKRALPAEVEGVLKDYIKNLENMDIMSKIFDFDEETNILRAMLNLNLNNN